MILRGSAETTEDFQLLANPEVFPEIFWKRNGATLRNFTTAKFYLMYFFYGRQLWAPNVISHLTKATLLFGLELKTLRNTGMALYINVGSGRRKLQGV